MRMESTIRKSTSGWLGPLLGGGKLSTRSGQNSIGSGTPIVVYQTHDRVALAGVGILWLLALPYEALWKRTYIDEHAIQPGQVTLYYDWANVHSADLYLNSLETLSQQNATQEERSDYLQESFSVAGLRTGNTSTSTWAHVTPPRSAGTEVILITANWLSKEGGLNLRGVAMLLSLGEFLRGEQHQEVALPERSSQVKITGHSTLS